MFIKIYILYLSLINFELIKQTKLNLNQNSIKKVALIYD